MIDSFVLLTPILMLPLVALLVFVGCSFSAPAAAGPKVPVLTATAGNGKVELSWPPDIEADKFQIKRGEASGVHSLLAEVFTGGFYIDTAVTNGTTYFYVVTAWVQQFETAQSNEEVVTPVGGAGLTSFVTAKVLGSLVTNASGSFGMVVQVGPGPISVTTLGRAFAPGNVQAHTVQLIDAITGAVVPGAFVSVDMAGGSAGDFRYSPLASPVTLSADTRYYLVSQETAGGDEFFNHDTTVTTTGVAAVPSAVRGDGVTFVEDQSGPNAYGPVDFQYIM